MQKLKLLKEVETYDDNWKELQTSSPTTEAMKKAINAIAKRKFTFNLWDARKQRKVTSEKSRFI